MANGPRDHESEFFHQAEKEKLRKLKIQQDADRAEAEAQRLRALHFHRCGKCGAEMDTQVFKGVEKGLLGDVLRVVLVAQHPPGEGVNPTLMPGDQLLEGRQIARLCPLDQGLIGGGVGVGRSAVLALRIHPFSLVGGMDGVNGGLAARAGPH